MGDLPIIKTENYQSITANNWIFCGHLGAFAVACIQVEYFTGRALLGRVSGELSVSANHLHSTV